MNTTKTKSKQNPIYADAFNTWKMQPGRTVGIGTTDTAKLIRAVLKARFPGTKFKVRSDKYAGGSSIRVAWVDGPTERQVEAQVGGFAGSGFDGMQDMKYHVGAWLAPDGSATVREVAPHWGTDGETTEAATDGAIPVSFSADFVFCDREHSIEHMRRSVASYAARYPGCPLAEAIKDGTVGVQESRFGGYEFTGQPSFIRDAVGKGRQYGGDCVLRAWAARRIKAT